MTNYGKNSTKASKLIGNKSITSIGLNGKWKLKVEKSIKSKEKKEDLNTSKEIKNTKNNKNYKNTSDKLNSATNSFNILTTSRLTLTELMKQARMIKNKPWTSQPKWLLTLNGKKKKFKSLFQRKPKFKMMLQPKRGKRTKIKTLKRSKNKEYSIFHTMCKINSKLWKYLPHHQLKKSTIRLKNCETESDCLKEDARKSKYQRMTQSCCSKSSQRNQPQDNKQDKRKFKLKTNSPPFEHRMID